jgi:stage III sporulation protein AA
MKGINGLNIRIAREIRGCASPLMKYVDKPLQNVLIISPPGKGKTTLLRDMARQLSDGGYNVGIVDERSEIAGTYLGVVQNDVGMRTDVLDGCPKRAGMYAVLRVMSPDVLVVDEIGGKDDADVIMETVNSGVKLLCTAHGGGVDEVRRKPDFAELVNKKVFGRYVVLAASGAIGKIEGVYDENMGRVDDGVFDDGVGCGAGGGVKFADRLLPVDTR